MITTMLTFLALVLSDGASVEGLRQAYTTNMREIQDLNISYSENIEFRNSREPAVTECIIDFTLHSGEVYLNNMQLFTANGNEIQRNQNEVAFDGRQFHVRNDNRSIHKFTKFDEEEAKHYMTNVSYLDAIGIALPKTVSEWHEFTSPHSSILKLIEQGKVLNAEDDGILARIEIEVLDPAITQARSVSSQELEQQLLDEGTRKDFIKILVERHRALASRHDARRITFEFAMRKGFALQRREDVLESGAIFQTVECSDFAFTGIGTLWLPKKCVVTSYAKFPERLEGLAETPERTATILVSQISNKPNSDAIFSFEPKSGDLVTIHDAEKEVFISPTGELELRAMAIATRGRLLFTGCVTLVAIGLAMFFLLRAKKKR